MHKISYIIFKQHFAVVKDHCGGKNCGPADLKDKSLIFMLNEMCSYLSPLRDVTDGIRSANQDRVNSETGEEKCMIERNFTPNSEYSEARRNELTAYSK